MGGFAASLALSAGCVSRPKAYAEVSVVSSARHRSGSNEALVQRAEAAVAVVQTPSGRGLGFVVDPRGYLVTNRHVVEDASHIESVSFPAHDPPRTYHSVEVIYTDPERDLALIRVHTDDILPRLPLAARKPVPIGRYLNPGDPVVLVEYEHPTEEERVPDPSTAHFISHNAAVTTLGAVNLAAGPGQFLGIDADVKRGQSGGPVLDRHGRVVGVITWTWRDRVGGFAIPVADVLEMLGERPALESADQHRDRIAARSREFLSALGRGDVEDARRITSPSHARQVRADAVDKITAQIDSDGGPVIQGFFAAVESLVEEDDAFSLLRDTVGRTATPQFREALALPEDLEDAQIVSFFFELGQAYLVARVAGDMLPQEALRRALMRLETIDAARTFAIADVLAELAGSAVEIQKVEVVPGAYSPTAVVSLARTPGPDRADRGRRLTLHMKLEWGDWYVTSVNPTPLSDRVD
ncbi:MAG: serine protease [Nannocystaceae bacterium]|nr:serine protease [Nannocystaceae bacterium]